MVCGSRVAVLGVLVCFLALVVAVILVPDFLRSRSEARLTGCTSNLQNLATALEMWSADHGKQYPTSLSQLTEGEKYLRMIPTCPAAGKDTYSLAYESSSEPDRYTVSCSGHHHGVLDVRPGYPQYGSVQGLVLCPPRSLPLPGTTTDRLGEPAPSRGSPRAGGRTR